MCVLLLVLTKFESLFWDTLCFLSHWEEALGDHFEVTGNYLSKNFMLFLIFKSFEVYFGTPCVLRSSEGLRRSSWGFLFNFVESVGFFSKRNTISPLELNNLSIFNSKLSFITFSGLVESGGRIFGGQLCQATPCGRV